MLSLTGTPAQVSEAAKKFRVYFSHIDRKEDSDEDYMGACLCCGVSHA
jgi:cytochrome oxidase Cu insertion factor (SCO1/SenC/PrrC family)